MNDWNQVVRRNAAQVVNTAFRVLGNLADAEDVAQEVFVEAYRKWYASESEHHWSGLLQRMAVRRSIDLLRSRRPTEPLHEQAQSASSAVVEQRVLQHELLEALRLAVASLPKREAEVFCLVYYEDADHNEVAKTLDISKQNVAAALSRARAKLAKTLRPNLYGGSK